MFKANIYININKKTRQVAIYIVNSAFFEIMG